MDFQLLNKTIANLQLQLMSQFLALNNAAAQQHAAAAAAQMPPQHHPLGHHQLQLPQIPSPHQQHPMLAQRMNNGTSGSQASRPQQQHNNHLNNESAVDSPLDLSKPSKSPILHHHHHRHSPQNGHGHLLKEMHHRHHNHHEVMFPSRRDHHSLLPAKVTQSPPLIPHKRLRQQRAAAMLHSEHHQLAIEDIYRESSPRERSPIAKASPSSAMLLSSVKSRRPKTLSPEHHLLEIYQAPPRSEDTPTPTLTASPIASATPASSVVATKRRQKTMLPCDWCGKAFDRPSLLKRHERTHTGEKPHVCDVCGKGFSTSSSLNTHRRIHSGEKPHECKVCGKRFTASSNLYYHRMTHNKEKPHKCTLCSKSFPTPGDLKSHMYVHNGSWPFRCTVCNRGFSKATNLKNHMALHNGNSKDIFDEALSNESSTNSPHGMSPQSGRGDLEMDVDVDGYESTEEQTTDEDTK